MSDLKTIFDAIQVKRKTYEKLDAYYHGDQPAIYLTQRLREIFRPLDITFNENWCAVVIDSVDERINLTGFESSDKTAENMLKSAWERNTLALEAADVHTDALVLGECYAIVWPDENGKAEVYYNDPRMVHAIYAAENPRKITVAGKLWTGEDGKSKMTLYYPDHLEYYTSSEKSEDVTSPESFSPDVSEYPTGQALNPYGQIPVFHFKINRKCVSDLTNVLPLQNGCNKLLIDMMVAAEFGAFSQRYVISQENPGLLPNEPSVNWWIPAGDGTSQAAQVGQFQSTDLKNYLDAGDRLATRIAIITRIPKHYFFTQSGDPSGEALIALEAPLNKKAQDRIDRFRPTWREVASFICLIEGIVVKAEEITPQFEKPETIQPRTSAEIVKMMVEATIPLDTALTRQGWTDSEIEAMNKIKDEGASKAQSSLASTMLEAERRFKTQPMPPNGGVNQTNQTMPMNGVKQNV